MKYTILVFVTILAAFASCETKERSSTEILQDINVVDSLLLGYRYAEANEYYSKYNLPDSLLYLKIEAISKLDSLQEIEKYLPRLKKYIPLSETHSLRNLKYIYYNGWLNRRKGNYAKADSIYHSASQIYTESNIQNVRLESKILTGLAYTQRILGNSKKSELLYQKAIQRIAEEYGVESIMYADAQINLAQFYGRIRVDDKFEQILFETKSNFKKEWEDSVVGSRLYSALAWCYGNKSDFNNAIKYRIQYLEMAEALFGDQHVGFANGTSNLGLAYLKLGEYQKALDAFAIAKKSFAKIFGEVHGAFIAVTEYEADTFVELGELEKALDPYLKVKEIRGELYGTHVIDYYGISLSDLGNLYTKQKKYDLAALEYTELDKVLNGEVRSVFEHLTEEEREQFIRSKYEPFLNAIRSITPFVQDQEYLKLQYNIALRSKGMQVKTSRDVLEYASKGDASQLPMALSALKKIEAELNQLLKKGGDGNQKEITATRFTRDSLEKLLVRGSAMYREEKAKAELDILDIQSSLAKGEAAIEFIHYDTGGRKGNDTIAYAALVLKGGTDRIEFIELFQEQEISARLGSSVIRRHQYVEDLYGSSTRAFSRVEDKSLFDLVWKPLYESLKDVKTIYSAPSGLLHRVSLGAIQDPQGDPIASKFKLYTINSTRHIIELKKGSQRELSTSFLIGGVDYETYASTTPASDEDSKTQHSEVLTSEFNIGRALRKSVWEPLDFTIKEVEDLKKKLDKSGIKCTVLGGVNASEEAFKALGQDEPSPSIIHIATHGYFFPESTEELDDEGNVFTSSDDAMIRSGLLLSGANGAWVMDSSDNIPGEDGIFTAAEIAQLNLDNTELVVLSACDTGLGDIEGSEGVYGLQRAFKKAGANALMLSLWQVPDELTSKFMERFYQFWLVDKMVLRDAFDAAQKHIRELPNVDTYGWAGFVLLE